MRGLLFERSHFLKCGGGGRRKLFHFSRKSTDVLFSDLLGRICGFMVFGFMMFLKRNKGKEGVGARGEGDTDADRIPFLSLQSMPEADLRSRNFKGLRRHSDWQYGL